MTALEPLPTFTLPADLDDLAKAALGYARFNRATSTQRAYANDWAHFCAWTAAHGLDSLPAAPETVALYVTDLASTPQSTTGAPLRPSTINRRLAAIAVHHKRAGYDSPSSAPGVREIMKGIRRSLRVAQREAAPAGIGEIRRMIAHLPSDIAGTRDRALLLVGFAGATRRSELVGLDVADIIEGDQGLAIIIRSSKTDQEGRGRQVAIPRGHDPETCPVRALQGWLEAAAIDDGPVFRPIDRHGNIASARLSDRAVALIVKRAAEGAGLDPTRYSGHSLRAGFATTAAANGAPERAIANQTGHKSMEVLRRYVRHGSLFTDNAATMLGL
jgi:integrase